MFPYLTVNVLDAAPDKVGIAQMFLAAPALLLMLPGGMLADASDLRRLMSRLQMLAVLPIAVLAFYVGEGALSFSVLLGFALVHGSLHALVTPTRDALLGRVAGGNVQRAITAAMSVQFLAQMVGFGVAAMAGTLGPSVALWCQCALYAMAALCALKMKASPPVSRDNRADGRSSRQRALKGMGEAFGLVLRSAQILPVTLVMVGIGLFFMSVFQVVVPVMVRDVYGGESGELALVNASFVVGVLISTAVLSRRAPVVKQGRAIFASASVGVLIIAAIASQPPMAVFYGIILVFGCGAGVVMTLGRTVIQETASAAHRARILAIYGVAFLGAAPMGAFFTGEMADRFGLPTAALIAATGMALLLSALALHGAVWRVRREPIG